MHLWNKVNELLISYRNDKIMNLLAPRDFKLREYNWNAANEDENRKCIFHR